MSRLSAQVRVDNMRFFAFSYFDLDGEKNTTHCDRTLRGWHAGFCCRARWEQNSEHQTQVHYSSSGYSIAC